MHRLVIFGDSSNFLCRRLTQAVMAALRTRDDIKLVAFVEAARHGPRSARMRRLARWARLIFDTAHVLQSKDEEPPELDRILRGWKGQWIDPPAWNINHPAVLRILREEIRPTLALSLGCSQIFRKDLLSVCRVVANYHNALLPSYRGVRAMSWAVYHGETRVGFTFHYMNEQIDEGAILVQKSIIAGPDSSVSHLDHQVCDLAAGHVETVVDMIIRGQSGVPQSGTPSYFGIKDLRKIRRIENVSNFSFDELKRRLRAFKWLEMRIDGRLCEVTSLDRVMKPKHKQAMITSDGAAVRASRFFCLPRPLYELYRLTRKKAPT